MSIALPFVRPRRYVIDALAAYIARHETLRRFVMVSSVSIMCILPHLTMLARYACVGVAASAISWVVFLTLYACDVWYVYAAQIASVAVLIFKFATQKKWVFKNSHRDQTLATVQWFLHTGMSVGLTVLSWGLLYGLVEYGSLHPILAQIVLTPVSVAAIILRYQAARSIFKN